MPQPLGNRALRYSYTWGQVALARPDLAGLVFQIIGLGADIETQYGRLLVSLAPQNAIRLARHLGSMDNDGKKRATIEAVASVSLSPEQHEILQSVLRSAASASKLRHPFAHGRIGQIDELDDALVLVNSKDEILAFAREIEPRPDGGRITSDGVEYEVVERMKGASLYRKKELEQICSTLKEALHLMDRFRRAISSPTVERRDQRLSELAKELGIAAKA